MMDWIFGFGKKPIDAEEPLPSQDAEEPVPSVVEAYAALDAALKGQEINTRLIEPCIQSYSSLTTYMTYRSKHYPHLHIHRGKGRPYISSVYGQIVDVASSYVQQKVAWDVLSTYPHRHLGAFSAYFHNTYDIYDCPTFVVETWDKKHRWTGSSPYAIAYEWREIP